MLPKVQLFDRASGRAIPALLRPVGASDLVLATRWQGLMPEGAPDADWEWDRFIHLGQTIPEWSTVHVLEAEGELQGLSSLMVSSDDEDVRIYGTELFRLSVAPWNRLPERRYWGAGSALVVAAITRSQEDGHEGRIHCAPVPTAEEFYQRAGMAIFDDLCAEGLHRYRFDREGALAFLVKMRQKGLIHLQDFDEDEDYLFDSGGARRLSTLARRLPPIIKRGATLIEGGRVHFKSPPPIPCPKCGRILERGIATIVFQHAPEATQRQTAPGWVCPCGESYVPGPAARAAHARAFGLAPIDPSDETL